MDRNDDRIKIVKDEIINMHVDAIVNPTDEYFSGSNELDKLIQKNAGEKLTKKLSKSVACKVGQSIITKGYNLNVKSIIHTCTPTWDGGEENEVYLLYSCYENSIELAVENENKTIAIPSISSGNNKFPLEQSANIAYYAAWRMIKMNKYGQNDLTMDDFIKNLGVENAYIIFLLKEAFLAGEIDLEFIEETVKVLKRIFLHIKNMSKNFTEKVYTEELDSAKEILNEIFDTINYETLEYAKERTKVHFSHANDYIFEKINNSFKY